LNNVKQILAVLSLVSLLACTPADVGNRAVGELASDRIELTAEVTEPIVEIAVPEGATVSTGQLLVRPAKLRPGNGASRRGRSATCAGSSAT